MKEVSEKDLQKVGNLDVAEYWKTFSGSELEPDTISEMVVDIILTRLLGSVHSHLKQAKSLNVFFNVQSPCQWQPGGSLPPRPAQGCSKGWAPCASPSASG